jgi:hypothetical protein
MKNNQKSEEISDAFLRLPVGSATSSLWSSLPIQRPGLESRCINGAKAPFITYAGARFLSALRYGGCARETFGSTGLVYPGNSSLRTVATHSAGIECGSFNL